MDPDHRQSPAHRQRTRVARWASALLLLAGFGVTALAASAGAAAATAVIPHAAPLANSVTAVSVQPNVTTWGTSVAYAAQVAASGGSGSVPTGSVSFAVASTTLCTATLVNGTASCRAASAPAAAAETVTATYGGDHHFHGSIGTTTLSVGQAQTTTAAIVPPTVTLGSNTTYQATVAGVGVAFSGQGSVAFTIGSIDLCTAHVTAAGSASCVSDKAPFLLGEQVTATFSGNTNFAGSSGNASFTVTTETTTTTATANPTSIPYGTVVTYSAEVISSAGGIPTGSVSFTIGPTGLCTAALVAGSGSCTAKNAFPGFHQTVTAVYSGAVGFPASTGMVEVGIAPAPAITTARATPSSAAFGTPITYSATVSSSAPLGVPTGWVTFSIGVESPIILCRAHLVAGSGACVARDTPPGQPRGVVAFYSGNAFFAGSGVGLEMDIRPAPTTTTPRVAPVITAYGSPVSYSARVTSAGGTPTGSVTFSSGATAMCTARLGAGSGSCTAADAPAGPQQTVTARYSGDQDFQPSTGSTTLSVAAGATSCSSSGHGAVAYPGGYWLVGANGAVYSCGDAPFYGSLVTLGVTPHQPVVGIASTPDGKGYWLVASDGGVFAFGDAVYSGSMGGHDLNAPVVGMAATAQGGYDEVAADGGLFTFGAGAVFHGSMAGHPLVQPVVGLALTPGGGYDEVASDGGIFTFGPGASFYGSMGGRTLNRPVVGLAVTPMGGYYEVASDGGIFAFGPGAAFDGSMGGAALNDPVVGMDSVPQGGYYEVASDGGIFTFGGGFFAGSVGGQGITTITGMTNP